MKVALGQFAVSRDWQENAAVCQTLMQQATAAGADLLVMPEAILARDNSQPGYVIDAAQPEDGPFMQSLLAASQKTQLTTIFTQHIPAADNRAVNTLFALRHGEIVARYQKLHLYDAFAVQESARVDAGQQVPPLLEVAGLQVGLMICYDVRFPELARRLALDGADVLVLPSAWLRGPLKERHWELLTTTRALENTCYMVAVGECGPKNIGNSLVADPLGVIVASAGEAPGLVFADIDPQRLSHARQIVPVLENRRFATPQLKTD
ncbi:deaminated glutathione amidase [Tatumella sp. UBA2305]|uniref:deaminated glutathione amidase n=1 Tax=Tatumella sp. UBA2305 TaxID=1947647 RepID=UPI0025E4237D|nr:deaminated glutathione amidase [Tatumella sp. UBA2305]